MAQAAKKGRVMVVEKTPEILTFIDGSLNKHYELDLLSSFEGLEHAIDRFDPEVVVIDGAAYSELCIRFCSKIRELDAVRGQFTGVILMVTNGDDPLIAQGAEAGVDCFCIKQFLGTQLPAVLKVVYRLYDMTEKLRAYSDHLLASNLELETLVITDELTGLFNMRFVKKRLADEFKTSLEKGLPLSVLMIDIDHFKQVNDSADHLLGSYVIGEVGKEIYSVTRRGDIPGRYGGDEFIIILPGTSKVGALTVAQRLHDRILKRVYSNGVDATQITISQGIGILDRELGEIHPATTPEELIRQADKALYQAKDSGRNAIMVFNNESPEFNDKKKAS